MDEHVSEPLLRLLTVGLLRHTPNCRSGRDPLQVHPAVRELRPGLLHWEALHPEWEPSAVWPQLVSSYAFDDGRRLLLFDPLAPPSEPHLYGAGDRLPVGVEAFPGREHLRPLLSLPVEHVLPTHGAPTDRAALERALAL
jgi:hypothetical protein